MIEAESYNSTLFFNFLSSAIENKTNVNKYHFYSSFIDPDSLQQFTIC